jgi:ABC-type multidrug transport system fused ATPase/permease subunit
MEEELWQKADERKQTEPREGQEPIPLPENVREAVAMHRQTIEHEMVNDFGIPEIPKQILSEMEFVMKAIAQKGKEKRYNDEVDEAVYARLQQLAIRIAHFKDEPTEIEITAVPEEGYRVSFRNNQRQHIERPLTEDEQDLLFQLEMWADQVNGVQNIEQFKQTLLDLEHRAQNKPESERQPFVEEQMAKKYLSFGFTQEQVQNLILLSGDQEISELVPHGKLPGMQKLKITKSVWDQYLSGEEKSRYIKLAAGMTVAGAVEGIAPTLLGFSMDSANAKMAALFALGYLGVQVGSGWVKRHLAVEFDVLLNDVTEKSEGLNEQLARDLVFQPGEKMARGEERGQIIASLRRSQSAFREILSAIARTSAPALASTTVGLGLMFANDWRLGLISLASAPIAIAISRRAEKRLEPIIEQTYETEAKVAQEVEEQIAAHQDIVLSGMRDTMADRLQELGKEQNRLAHDRQNARLDMQFQAGQVLNSGITAALTAGGVALREMGVQEAGKIVTALVYSGMFRNSFDQIVYANSNLLESLGAILQMEEVFNGYAQEEAEADVHRVGASEISEFSIDVQGVSLEIDDKKIIDDVSFQVPAGGVVRLEGQSGHGKTTMTRLMSGYYQPTVGEVSIGGHRSDAIKKTGPDSLYRHMAYLSQHFYIFESGNVKANLAFGNEGIEEARMEEVLRELGLAGRFTKNGELDLGSKVQGLSGGERARLGLARVLLKIRSQKNGSVVFLDQPTDELDAKTELEVAQILLTEKRKHPKTTFVIISHSEDFIHALEKPSDGTPGMEIQRVRFEKGKISQTE